MGSVISDDREIDQNAEKVFTGDMSTMLCRYNPHLFSNINETQTGIVFD